MRLVYVSVVSRGLDRGHEYISNVSQEWLRAAGFAAAPYSRREVAAALSARGNGSDGVQFNFLGGAGGSANSEAWAGNEFGAAYFDHVADLVDTSYCGVPGGVYGGTGTVRVYAGYGGDRGKDLGLDEIGVDDLKNAGVWFAVMHDSRRFSNDAALLFAVRLEECIRLLLGPEVALAEVIRRLGEIDLDDSRRVAGAHEYAFRRKSGWRLVY